MMQFVKSVSGTWHVFGAYVKSSTWTGINDGGMLAQTQCDRLVKVARLSNTKPSGKRLNPMSFCVECRWNS